MEDSSKALDVSNKAMTATKITSDHAKKLFRDYHKVPFDDTATLADSQGKLTVRDGSKISPLQHFVVDYKMIITKLMDRAEEAKVHFLGLAGIPAKNDDGDTFIWVAVVADDAEGKIKRRFLLPERNDQDDFIYDYIETCPALCDKIDNQANLWKNWLAGDSNS